MQCLCNVLLDLRQATLHKVGRYYQDEFQKNQDEWEAHLAGHKHGALSHLGCSKC